MSTRILPKKEATGSNTSTTYSSVSDKPLTGIVLTKSVHSDEARQILAARLPELDNMAKAFINMNGELPEPIAVVSSGYKDMMPNYTLLSEDDAIKLAAGLRALELNKFCETITAFVLNTEPEKQAYQAAKAIFSPPDLANHKGEQLIDQLCEIQDAANFANTCLRRNHVQAAASEMQKLEDELSNLQLSLHQVLAEEVTEEVTEEDLPDGGYLFSLVMDEENLKTATAITFNGIIRRRSFQEIKEELADKFFNTLSQNDIRECTLELLQRIKDKSKQAFYSAMMPAISSHCVLQEASKIHFEAYTNNLPFHVERSGLMLTIETKEPAAILRVRKAENAGNAANAAKEIRHALMQFFRNSCSESVHVNEIESFCIEAEIELVIDGIDVWSDIDARHVNRISRELIDVINLHAVPISRATEEKLFSFILKNGEKTLKTVYATTFGLFDNKEAFLKECGLVFINQYAITSSDFVLNVKASNLGDDTRENIGSISIEESYL